MWGFGPRVLVVGLQGFRLKRVVRSCLLVLLFRVAGIGFMNQDVNIGMKTFRRPYLSGIFRFSRHARVRAIRSIGKYLAREKY